MRRKLSSDRIQKIAQPLKMTFIIIGACIVLASTYFTNKLGNELALEEKKKIEIWAEAATINSVG